MSFQRYLADLDRLRENLEIENERFQEADNWGKFTVSEDALNELLEDLTDYARAHGDEPLFEKLHSLQVKSDDNYGYSKEREFPEVLARVIRITRVLETFGSGFLNADSPPIMDSRDTKKKGDPFSKNNTYDRVFVVHGHDNATLYRVKEILLKLGLKPIILREQANGGKTVIEKFEKYSDVGFAVVLMTADDIGGSLEEVDSGSSSPRARQNVIMELGFFASKLGRERICVLKGNDVEAPSDIMGVVYTPIDSGEAWRLSLAQELSNAGYSVDLNELI